MSGHDEEMMAFEYDDEEGEQDTRKRRKPLTKLQHLYGDDWQDSSGSEQQQNSIPDDFGLPSVTAKINYKRFVKSETLEHLNQADAKIQYAKQIVEEPQEQQAPLTGFKRRHEKQDDKTQELEKKLTQKYGKALKMLQKAGGFQLGQGIGKSNQGILNPVEAIKIGGKGGIGVNKDVKTIGGGDINMDLKDIEAKKEEQARIKEVQLGQKQALDDDERNFIAMLRQSKKKTKTERVSYKIPDVVVPVKETKFVDMTQPKQSLSLVQTLEKLKTQSRQRVKSHISKLQYLDDQELTLKYQIQSSEQNLDDQYTQLLKIQKLGDSVRSLQQQIVPNQQVYNDLKEIFLQDPTLYKEQDVSLLVVKQILQKNKVSFDLLFEVRKILEISRTDQEVEMMMYAVFDNYWLPNFNDLRKVKPQAVQSWATIMPEMYLQKYKQQFVLPFITSTNADALEWAEVIGDDLSGLFRQWLEAQKSVDYANAKKWIEALPAEKQQLGIYTLKAYLAKLVSKVFVVDPSNQDIRIVEQLFTFAPLFDISDIPTEIVLPQLLTCIKQWLQLPTFNPKEAFTWYQGWKHFIQGLCTSNDVQFDKMEEIFYLVCLLINQNLKK